MVEIMVFIEPNNQQQYFRNAYGKENRIAGTEFASIIRIVQLKHCHETSNLLYQIIFFQCISVVYLIKVELSKLTLAADQISN